MPPTQQMTYTTNKSSLSNAATKAMHVKLDEQLTQTMSVHPHSPTESDILSRIYKGPPKSNVKQNTVVP